MLVNLFGTSERIAWGLGNAPEAMTDLGEALADLHNPRAPRGLKQAWEKRSLLTAALNMRTRRVEHQPDPGRGGRCGGSGQAPHPMVLAGRAGAAHHLAAGDHLRAR
jgi:hypothetical protein